MQAAGGVVLGHALSLPHGSLTDVLAPPLVSHSNEDLSLWP